MIQKRADEPENEQGLLVNNWNEKWTQASLENSEIRHDMLLIINNPMACVNKIVADNFRIRGNFDLLFRGYVF